MHIGLSLAALAAAVLLAPAAAQAAVHLGLDFTGAVSSGSGTVSPADVSPETTSFAGQPVTISLSITRDAGTTFVDHVSVSWSQASYALPFITAWSGDGVPFTPDNESQVAFFSIVNLGGGGGSVDIFPTPQFVGVTDSEFDLDFDFQFSQPHDPLSAFTDPGLTGAGGLNAFRNFVFDPDIGPFDADSHVIFTLDSLSQTRGVPEPATWSLMLLGFGALGTALRRRPPSPTLAR